jgi:hypothetical protein
MSPHNERENAGRREDDQPVGLAQSAFRFANDHGPVALIAVAAIGFMGWLWLTSLQGIAKDLSMHVRDSSWYQRQTCINMATMAGAQVALCDPPADRSDR